MCDVSGLVDLEETKDGIILEPLPEPLLIILSPPPPFLPYPGEPPMRWLKWLKAFEHYMHALDEKELADSSKLLLLRNSLGSEGEHVFSTLIKGDTTYAAAISALTDHFRLDRASQVHNLKFHQRVQMPGETVDQFVSALKELLRPCNCSGSIKEKLLLDQLIEKTNNLQLREMLQMRKETLTFSSALAMAKELEMVLKDSMLDFHEVNVDIEEYLEPTVQIKRKRGRPRRGEERVKAKPQVAKTQRNSSTLKDDYYYSNDKLYYSDDEDKPQAVDENNHNKVNDCNSASTFRRMEEDSSNGSVVLSSTKRQALCCSLCTNRCFYNVNKLNRHMRMHTQEKPFACPVCEMRFSQSYHMTRHMRSQHDAGQFVCSTCGESHKSLAELRMHNLTHKSKVLFCPECYELFTDKGEFSTHIKSHTNNSMSQTERGSSQQAGQVPVKRKRGRPRRGEEKNKTQPLVRKTASTKDEDENDHSHGRDGPQAVENLDCSKAGDDDTSSTFRMTKEDGNSHGNVLPVTKNKGFYCHFCIKHFNKAARFTRHMRTHTKEKPFACPVCEMRFSQSYHMTRHMRNQHDAGQFICSTCGESHKSLAELRMHNLTHKSKVLFCPECYELFTDKGEFSTHIKSHTNNSTSQTEGGSSQQAGQVPVKRKRGRPRRGEEKNKTQPLVRKTASTKDEDENNHSNGRDGPQAVENLDCSKAGDDDTSSTFRMTKEDGNSHENVLPVTKNKGFYCHFCIKHFNKADRFTRHMRTHTKEKPFTCPICEMRFSQPDHMTRHMRNLHAAGQFVCSVCGDSLESFADLLKHNKTHKSQVLFCPDCNEKFTNNNDLCSHVKTHRHGGQSVQQADLKETKEEEVLDDADSDTAESEFHPAIGQSNSRSTSGKAGKKSATTTSSKTQTKRHVCPLCVDRHFKGPDKLARHMRSHTQEKPFICPCCDLKFSQSYHMTRHVRNQHSGGQYFCPTCRESFTSCAELASHKNTHKSQVVFSPDCNEQSTNKDELCSHTNDSSSQTDRRHSHQAGGIQVKTEADAGAASLDADSGGKEFEVRALPEDDSADEATSNEDGSKNQVVSKTEGHFCPVCVNKCFRGPAKLARHMRTHSKEKPFTCPVCTKAFSQSYHMTRHVRNQHDLGKHVCAKCGKSFSTWLDLKIHRKAHAVDGLTCLACDKQFKGSAALVSHLKLHRKVKSKPGNLKCSDCDKEFGRLYHLKRHVMSHCKAANADFYTCPDCQKNFLFPEDLNKHLEIHAKENSGTCPKCNATFDSAGELEAHMVAHNKTYPCNTCGKKFKVEYALKKHEQSHQNEQYYCSTCRKHFFKVTHYKRHLMVHDRRESRCPHCDAVFLKLTAFKYHLRTHTEERPHQCSCCIETFAEKEELDKHALKHRKIKKERPYSCTRCVYAFTTLIELTEHMGLHEGELPETCPICGKTFLNKDKLERHVTIHNGERPHLCSICGNGFTSAASLKLHVLIHTGEKPFRCAQCGKSFSSNSGLRLHSRQHMDKRPSYNCPECGRSYGRMTELKMHQRYHTGDKPHACTCCSKRFISKDKLNVHMRTHTGERPFSCPHCGQTFTQTGDRNRHMSKFHPLSENTFSDITDVKF